MTEPKVGFVCFGEINTPKELIIKKSNNAKKLLKEAGLEVLDTAPVSDDPEGKDVCRAIKELSSYDFDLLVICIAGWIPSHAVISITSMFSHKPMLLWGLCGKTVNGRLVTTAEQAGTTALRKPMEDLGYQFKYVYGVCDTPQNMETIKSFAIAAKAVSDLNGCKVGMMGFRDMNLYGTLYDGVSLRKKIGPEVEFFEMLEVVQKMEKLDEEKVSDIINKIKSKWVFEEEPKLETLKKGVKYYLAIKEIVTAKKYKAVSLIDVDGMKKLANFPPSMIMMLLGDDPGVCTIPENDTLGAVTQLITKYLTGQASAYMEFYEFMEDRVLIGVPDYVPTEIVEGPVKVKPTSFGGFSEGILNISQVKTGAITMCRLTSTGDKYQMHVVTGKAVSPRSWEEAGWEPPAPQLPSLEVILDVPVEDFAQKVMGQHYIITYGNNHEKIIDLCNLLGVEVI